MLHFCLALLSVVMLLILPFAESQSGLPVLGRTLLVVQPRCGPSCHTEDLESRLRHDCEDGELQSLTPFQAALIAGGVQSLDELQRMENSFDQLCDAVSSELLPSIPAKAKLDLIQRRLHGQLLTGEYRAEFSELHRTLKQGHFNCLTATILFQSLADACGVPTRAIAARSHVLCAFRGDSLLYVETTSPDWHAVQFHDCPASIQSLIQEGRELSPVQLLGKIYYNRGVVQLEAAQFANAAQLLHGAWQFDPEDLAARENLLATYNNWALAECDRGNFRVAHELLMSGLAIDSHFGPLLANDLHVHQHWVRSLCEAGNYPAAIQLLEQGYLRRPDAELFDRGRTAVYQLWARNGMSIKANDRREE